MKTKSASLRTLGTVAAIGLGLVVAAAPAQAFQLYKSDGLTVNGDLTIALGVFNSVRSYNSIGVLTKPEAATWFEGLGTYGVSGEYQLGNKNGTLFGAFDLFSGADRGDHNAAGITTGDEYQTQIQNAYLGWRSGDTIPWLGHDGLKITVGRKFFQLGTGFLIGGDRISLGKGFNSVPGAPGGLERAGGTYYIGSLSSFSHLAVLELGSSEGLDFKAFHLKSDNKYQAEESLIGGNLEYHDAKYGMLGVTYLRGLDVSRVAASFLARGYRKGQNIWSGYGNTSLGIKQLSLTGQYVREANSDETGTGQAHAWYASAQWTFNQLPWSPSVTYRFSRFGVGYDPMFFGFADFGTWFQGEVASNYAGPFSTGADIQLARLAVAPSSTLQLAVNYFHLGNTPGGALNANEIDAYAVWTVFGHYTLIPLVGYYNPKKSAAGGGSQLGGSGPNIYTELVAIISF